MSTVPHPNFQQKVISIAVAIVMIVVGLFIALSPGRTFYFMFIIAFFVLGFYEFFKYRTSYPKSKWRIVGGIASILFACFSIGNVTGIVAMIGMVELIVPIWAIVTGIIHIVQGMEMRKAGLNSSTWVIVSAILGIILGIILLAFPIMGILTMVEITGMLIGVLMLIFGINVIIDAFV